MAIYSNYITLSHFLEGGAQYFYSDNKNKVIPVFLKKNVKNINGNIYRNSYLEESNLLDFLRQEELQPLLIKKIFIASNSSLTTIFKKNIYKNAFTLVHNPNMHCYIGPGCILDKNFNPLFLAYKRREENSEYVLYINPNIYNIEDKVAKHIIQYLIPSCLYYHKNTEIYITSEINSLIIKNDKPKLIENHSEFVLNLLEKNEQQSKSED